jgi:uncharacterized protein YcbK (DUF882 family)
MGWHVTTKVAHRKLLSSHSARAGYCCSIAALLIFFGCHKLQSANAEGDTRTISFHHVHTDEELTVTYKVNGRYDEEALRKINHLLRDWRESEPTKMDPHLIDLLWEVHREVGAKEAIWIICGYRSPQTNSMLRRRSSGVAEFSQHTLGKAIDFYIPGVPLERLREVGLRAQRGGVGFYPTSGAPFVHMDTGSVRHWPRMPEAQLASVLAKGQLKSTPAQADTTRSAPSLFARLFGGGRDEDEDAKTAAAPAKPARGSCCRCRIAHRKGCRGAAAAGQTGQAGKLPGGVGNLEARRQADPRLRVFGDRRRAGKLPSRVGNLQAGASRAGSGSGRAHRRVGKRHHQRAGLLAGTAERRGRGRAAGRHARNGSRSPPWRRRRHRQRRSSHHGKRHPVAADRSRRQRADPECSRLRGAAHSDRDRAYPTHGPGNVACRTRCAAGNDHRGQTL